MTVLGPASLSPSNQSPGIYGAPVVAIPGSTSLTNACGWSPLHGHSLPFMALAGFSNRSIGTFHNPHCVELFLSFLSDPKGDTLSHC